MDGPISPPPIIGSAVNQLPAYISNGVVGLKVRDNPLIPGMALLSGFSGEHPERKIESAAFAPYPIAGDICLDGVWMSDAPQCIRIIDQAYDFSNSELTSRMNFRVGDPPCADRSCVILQPGPAHGGLSRNSHRNRRSFRP